MFRTRKVIRKHPPPAPDGSVRTGRDAGRTGRSGTGVIVAVLGFAIAFPLVAKLSGIDVAVVSATLAALPGILYAALSRS